MSNGFQGQRAMTLPRPGPVLKASMATLFLIWLVFALALNWGGATEQVFLLFVGKPGAIASGELWRLVTPLLLHSPAGNISHILTALLGLYFLGHSLEEAWGGRRFLTFMASAGVGAYAIQQGALALLPPGIAARLSPPIWFGVLPVVEAIAIAWALSFKGRTVHLFFVLPISSRGLLLAVVGFNVLMVVAGVPNLSGHLAAFGGMLLGWFLGGGHPSPARRMILKMRMASLEAEQKRLDETRRRRVKRSGLRVIEGGQDPTEDDSGDRESSNDKPKWLN